MTIRSGGTIGAHGFEEVGAQVAVAAVGDNHHDRA